MSPTKTLARESYFPASIFSKTLILFSKTHTHTHSPLARFLQIKKKISLDSSKVKTIFPI